MITSTDGTVTGALTEAAVAVITDEDEDGGDVVAVAVTILAAVTCGAPFVAVVAFCWGTVSPICRGI